jgi:hypothetical protein
MLATIAGVEKYVMMSPTIKLPSHKALNLNSSLSHSFLTKPSAPRVAQDASMECIKPERVWMSHVQC